MPHDLAAARADAVAGEVAPSELAGVLETFNERSTAHGLLCWAPDQLTGSGRFRLYQARVQQMCMLDEHDERVPVRRPALSA